MAELAAGMERVGTMETAFAYWVKFDHAAHWLYMPVVVSELPTELEDGTRRIPLAVAEFIIYVAM